MDGRRALVTIMVGSTFLLGACVAPQWTRPDYSAVQTERDELACQAQAERELSRRPPGFYGSLSEFYGQNYQPPTGRMPQRYSGPPGPMFDIDPVHRMLEEDRISDACMRAKGYMPEERATKPSPPVPQSAASSA